MKKIILLISFLISLSNLCYAKNIQNEQFTLMYDSFIFSKDLQNAYKVAKNALENEPTSYFWNQKMSEISLWTGRYKESIKYLINIYKMNKDPLISNEIIKRLIASYQYEKALKFIIKKIEQNNYDNKDIELMSDIYDKVGRPKESIKILKKLYEKDKQNRYLSDILSIYLKTGEIDKAKKIVKKLQKNKIKDAKTALAISEYYFVKKDLDRSYLTLLNAKKNIKVLAKNREFFKKISDLGWYLQKYESAVYGSLMLYKSKTARLIDYERVAQVYKNSNSTIIKDISILALKQHNNSKFFLDYAQMKIEKREFKEIDFEINKISKDKTIINTLKNRSRFWLIKATIDKHFKRDNEAKKSIKNSILLSPSSAEVTAQILWYLIDNFEYKMLNFEVKKIEKKGISSKLYHPLAAAYQALEKPDIAIKYLKKSIKNEPKNIELRFLYLSILTSQGEDKKREDELKKISKILSKQAKNNPNLKKNKKFLRQYLETSLDIVSSKKFLNLLKASKNRLTIKDYKQLQIAHALKYKKYDKAYKIQASMVDKNPITEMEIARLRGKTHIKKALMKKFSYTVPKYMKIENAENKNQMQKAIRLTKLALLNNKKNQYLTNKLNTLNRSYGDKIEIGFQKFKQGALNTQSINLNGFYYLSYGLGLLIDLKKSKYKHQLTNIFESNDISAQVGIRKHIYNGDLELNLFYRDAKKDTIGFILNANKRVNEELDLKLSAKTNSKIEDASTILLLSGKKNSASIQTNYKISLNKTLIFLGEYQDYYTFENEKIGSGLRGRLSFNYNFKTSTNMDFELFYTLGNFSENSNTNSIKKQLPILEQNTKLIEQDSQNIGVGFNYADGLYQIGTTFQPYLNISGLYSNKGDKVYTSTTVGFKNSFSKNDMYKIELNYLSRFNNLGDEKFGINLIYSKLF